MSACYVCERRTSGNLPLCRYHFDKWRDQMHEPWFRALKNFAAQDARQMARDMNRLTSLEYLQELHLAEYEKTVK